MDRNQLNQQIQNRKLQGVYLFDGTEEYLKHQAMDRVRESLFPDGMEELNTIKLTAPDTDSLQAACETVPFMADKRLVLVEDEPALVGRREADDELLDYMQHIPDTCVLIYYCHGKADSRRKLAKRIDKAGGYITFNAMSEAELADWIIRGFEEAGKVCSMQTANELVFMAGNDATLLKGEMEKLIALTGDREQITHSDLEAVVTRTSEYKTWELVNQVVAGEETKAFRILHEMLANGESSIMILVILGRQYRMMQHLSILQYEHKTKQEMQKALGIQSFALDRTMAQTRALSGRVIRESVRLCLEVDDGIKSGKIAEDGAVEALILRLFALRRGTAQT